MLFLILWYCNSCMNQWHHLIIAAWDKCWDSLDIMGCLEVSASCTTVILLSPTQTLTPWHPDTLTPWHPDTLTPHHQDLIGASDCWVCACDVLSWLGLMDCWTCKDIFKNYIIDSGASNLNANIYITLIANSIPSQQRHWSFPIIFYITVTLNVVQQLYLVDNLTLKQVTYNLVQYILVPVWHRLYIEVHLSKVIFFNVLFLWCVDNIVTGTILSCYHTSWESIFIRLNSVC